MGRPGSATASHRENLFVERCSARHSGGSRLLGPLGADCRADRHQPATHPCTLAERTRPESATRVAPAEADVDHGEEEESSVREGGGEAGASDAAHIAEPPRGDMRGVLSGSAGARGRSGSRWGRSFASLDIVDGNSVLRVRVPALQAVSASMRGPARSAFRVALECMNTATSTHDSHSEARGWKFVLLVSKKNATVQSYRTKAHSPQKT